MNGTQQPYEYSLLPKVSFTLQHSGDAFIVFTIVNTLNLFPRLPLESELFQHYYSAAKEGCLFLQGADFLSN